MYSGGAGSWATAMRVKEQYGNENLYLVFADTLTEDEDLYRFLDDTKTQIGGTFIHLKEGRDIWQVFKDDRFLGNSRLANCSKYLKQKPSREWLEANFKPDECIVYIGIDWSELHRLPAIEKAYLPYTALAPMTEKPYMDKNQIIEWLEKENIKPPRLYGMGFAHNNCGGFCVRSGQAQFKRLLETFPERYAHHEQKEQEMITFLGKDISILRKQVNKEKEKLTMKKLREDIESQLTIDEDDWGGVWLLCTRGRYTIII
jgi:3'-phosphoadenosine 5'-phosphosulfate sulfotransferase (PAPS reductase)/FAD synthetase